MTPCRRASPRITPQPVQHRSRFCDHDYLIKHLAQHPNVSKSCVIGPLTKIYSLIHFKNYLLQTETLSHLQLKQPRLLPGDLHMIGVGLAGNKSIQSLALSENEYDSTQFGIILPALKGRTTKLENLQLDGNRIDTLAARHLGNYLWNAYDLRHLTVRKNPIDDEALSEIAKGLAGAPHIKYISFANCKISSAGAYVLLQSLRFVKSESLFVNLEGNQIGASAAEALQNWAASSKNKRRVTLRGNVPVI